ncbi:MAG TPA: MFS transporter [Dokdonella sp.]|uniref:MFS transporter n=1 Tax=Dokdonella sp. TaxID=2291710 RepID=UPI002CB5F6AD|nr:MFS transporter [Dokdonella sp.]HOX70339.1 MFS transporter [Dokdonella sp.]HPG93790.1 MFS transporter [Dokdonella sp.]HPN79303.1 MFS transporter [Dokdonella sp.]
MSIPAEVIAGSPDGSSSNAAVATAFPILATLSFCHLLNDMIQSLLPAIYPLLKSSFALDFGQVGLITLTFQCTASLLQPMIGMLTDRHPRPYSLAIGMTSTLLGLLLLSRAPSFPVLLVAAAMIGTGSAVFHPESSRIARLASGGRHGLAQSLFQVGGNVGSATGPLLAAFIIMPRGQSSIAWFALAAMIAIVLLGRIGHWYRLRIPNLRQPVARAPGDVVYTRRQVVLAIGVLGMLIFSKYFYLASLSSYYTFYLIHKFGISVQSAQLHLFIFLAAVAAGTIIGGPVGDRIGRRYVIWASILGVLPFTLLLPHANLLWTTLLTIVIGLVLASAFAAILVFAQELVPGRTGMISGLFFGFAFGMGGIGAAVLGQLADHIGIEAVYRICAWLPAIGLLAWFLPRRQRAS